MNNPTASATCRQIIWVRSDEGTGDMPAAQYFKERVFVLLQCSSWWCILSLNSPEGPLRLTVSIRVLHHMSGWRGKTTIRMFSVRKHCHGLFLQTSYCPIPRKPSETVKGTVPGSRRHEGSLSASVLLSLGHHLEQGPVDCGVRAFLHETHAVPAH